MNELLENLLEEDLFQPFSEEEFAERVLKDYTKNPDGTYSCKGDVDLRWGVFPKLPFRFKRVEGDFICTNCGLETLEGCPEYVGKDFICSDNNLTTLGRTKICRR